MVLTFETLGFSDTYEVLFFLYMVLFVASTVGFYVPDRFGRRPRKSPPPPIPTRTYSP
jgi:hypothetical protein